MKRRRTSGDAKIMYMNMHTIYLTLNVVDKDKPARKNN